MKMFEDPIQFIIKKKIEDIEIEYFNLMEISQGGPVTGNLSINGEILDGRYGGPSICKDKYVYLPVLIKKILGTGFKLVKIDLNTLEYEYLGKTKDLIFIDKIEGDKIYFYEDISKTIYSYYNL